MRHANTITVSLSASPVVDGVSVVTLRAARRDTGAVVSERSAAATDAAALYVALTDVVGAANRANRATLHTVVGAGMVRGVVRIGGRTVAELPRIGDDEAAHVDAMLGLLRVLNTIDARGRC